MTPWLQFSNSYFFHLKKLDLPHFWCTENWFSYMCILFQILFHYRLLQDTEYGSLCYAGGPCCFSILYIVVCYQLIPNSQFIPLFPFANHKFFLYVCVYFCFKNKFICIIFLDSTYKWYYIIFVFSVWLALLSMIISRSIHAWRDRSKSISFAFDSDLGGRAVSSPEERS